MTQGGAALHQTDHAFEAFLQKTAHGFTAQQLGPMTALSIPMFAQTGLVRAWFTTRRYGQRDDLKLSIARMGATDEIVDNFLKAFDCAGIDPQDTVIANAQHGTDVLPADETHRGWGLFHLYTENDPGFDGMVTDRVVWRLWLRMRIVRRYTCWILCTMPLACAMRAGAAR